MMMARVARLAVTGLALLPLTAFALQPLEDKELGDVTGQEGVAISIEYYYNSTRTNDPATTGAGLSSCTDGGLADMDCRLSWQLANRGNAGSAGIYASTTWTLPNGGGCDGAATCFGEWLVWKAGWMSVAVNELSLDASFMGEAVSSGVAYEGWLASNLVGVYGSFVDSTGTCLMPADPSGTYAACTANYMRAMPALRAHYAGTSGGYNSGTRQSSGFSDVKFGLQVTGLSAEYDDGTDSGWQLNNFDSFTSLRIADNNANQAGIAFGGDFYLYGF